MLTLIGAGCFSTGVYYTVNKFEEQVLKWDSNYKLITEKVYAFEKVSDPKTIRLYVNELNKILDDIDFLHTLIESGQIADAKLDDYLASKQSNVDELKETLSSITTEVDSMLTSSHDHMHLMVEELQDSVKTQLTESSSEVTSTVDDLNKQITSLLKSIGVIQKDIWCFIGYFIVGGDFLC